MMKKNKLFLVAAWMCSVLAATAQTANNDPVTVKWALTTGNLETGVCAPETQSQFITPGAMTIGSGITIAAESSSDKTGVTSDGYTQTFFKASKSGDNTITFTITPKEGITFTPTKVGLKMARWKTDKGDGTSVAWVNGDGTTKSLDSFKPNREGTDATCSIKEYTMEGSIASDKTCKLVVTINGMDGKKTVSMGDVFIEGVTNGTVGQAITHNLTVVANPAEAGSVSVSPAGTVFERGSSVTLSQTTNEGWVFAGWYSNGAFLSKSSTYTFNIMGNMDVEAKYQSEASMLVGDYTVVDNIAAFRAAIKQFNETPTAQRRFIFLKNGDYDYGNFDSSESGVNLHNGRDTIKVSNISIIGESKEGVVIHIQPTEAKVSRTSPIVVGSGTSDTYFQDLTLSNNFAYSGNDGQAAALMDKGDKTIMKNVKMMSSQDTYYPNTDTGRIYLENCDIEGTVDYVCGRGDVYLYKCNLLNKTRYPKNGEYSGGTDIAAPYTIVEDFNQQGGHGFVFESCHVDCKSQIWDFGRGWRGWPKMAFLNTVFSDDAKMRIGVDQTKGKTPDNKLRVGQKSIQTSSDCHAMEFYEYNTMDEQGNVISPSTNELTFTASDSKTIETILKASEIDRFSLQNIFPGWQPDLDSKQVAVTKVERSGNTLSWTTDQKAKAFLIEQDGNFVTIVDGTQNSFDASAYTGKLTVRAANMMGGFGLPTQEGQTVTAISKATTDSAQVVNTAYYSLSGARLATPQHGVNIVVKTLSNGNTIVTKELK